MSQTNEQEERGGARKHTLGPWGVRSNSTKPFFVDAPEGAFAVAGCYHYHVSREVAEANARLIAAAPELLEALKAMVAQFDLDEIESPFKGQVEAHIKADAALSKAEGKDQ